MNPREKRLFLGVAAVLGVIVLYSLVEYFFKHQQLLRAELRSKTDILNTHRILLEEKDLYEKRNAWLQSVQPRLTNESGAGVALLDQVKQVAAKHAVVIEAPAINSVQKNSSYISVSVNFEVKCSWPKLCEFLRDLELQGPERFVAFENATLQSVDNDPSQLMGRFRLAKWFAPK